MHIEKAKITNFRKLRSAEVEFNATTNILVGDNESGKTTLLEAVNLALTGQLGGRNILFDLHPFLFNQEHVDEYVAALRREETPQPPYFQIELFLSNDEELATLRGQNNSDNSDQPGLMIRAELNDAYADHYQEYVENPERVTTVPVEFYRVVWRSFAGNDVTPRTRPIRTTMIDTGDLRYGSGPQNYVLDVVSEYLAPPQRANLALSYRQMKETFQADESVAAINEALAETRGEISDKTISVSLDATAKGKWEAGIMTSLDNIPFNLIGKGEQSSVKVQLAMGDAAEVQVFLIEEPENHLSHTKLHQLLTKIEEKAAGRQTFITTHSSFVLNKLDVGQVILFNGESGVRLTDLTDETRDYFKKLPGHDTLRMILANKVILAEGPSDELIIQKAILQRYGRTNLSLGTDIISVKSLAFRRFLEISRALNIPTRVITDNDGNTESLREKYSEYDGVDFIEICYDENEDLPSLEEQLIQSNGLAALNETLGQDRESAADLLTHMKGNKTESALRIFNSPEPITIPEYIRHAIRELDN